ncbi:MAG: cobalamin B12-binding domain-containing protein [Dehalococcoidia bacterium]|nr:MAG: cobalamin B12-binding domain-containing protein [Dehalococcoidia bacterium]
MADKERIRVIVAKPGLDGHDRGAKVVARALRDNGMEVIYTGLRQTPDMIAQSALQEDADVVGVSILSGAHLELFPVILEKLREKGLGNTVVLAGGIIPEEDHPALRKMGIEGIFGPGTPTNEIAEFIRKAVAEKKAS